MAQKASDPEERQPTGATGIRELPLVALRETVIFPEMIVPLQVGREKSVAALNAAVASGGPIALVTQRQAEREEITDPSELYSVGTLGKIAQVVQLQDGTVRAIVQGQSRLRVLGFVQTSPYILARIEERDFDVFSERVRLTAAEKTAILVRARLGFWSETDVLEERHRNRRRTGGAFFRRRAG